MQHGKQVLYDGVVSKAAWQLAEGYPGIDFLLVRAAYAGGATVLASRRIDLPHPQLSKLGSPPGGTAWVGLDESHITLHWYDDGATVRFALDVFTCGECANARDIMDRVLAALPGSIGRVVELERFKSVELASAAALVAAQAK